MSKDETKDRTWSISELSKEFDITPRTIRFYEDQGLLHPSRRGQTRIYDYGDRVRLKLVLRGKRLGFSLAETLRLFELYDTDKTSATQLKSMLEMVEDKKSPAPPTDGRHQSIDDGAGDGRKTLYRNAGKFGTRRTVMS